MIQRQSSGKLPLFAEGLRAYKALKPGDRVLIAEACNHNRITDICNDIGMVQASALHGAWCLVQASALRCRAVLPSFFLARSLLSGAATCVGGMVVVGGGRYQYRSCNSDVHEGIIVASLTGSSIC